MEQASDGIMEMTKEILKSGDLEVIRCLRLNLLAFQERIQTKAERREIEVRKGDLLAENKRLFTEQQDLLKRVEALEEALDNEFGITPEEEKELAEILGEDG